MQTDEYGSTFKETTIKEDKISRSGAKIAQTCAATILKNYCASKDPAELSSRGFTVI